MSRYSSLEHYNSKLPLRAGDLIYVDFEELDYIVDHFQLYQHKWLRVNKRVEDDNDRHVYRCSYDPELNNGEVVVLPWLTFRDKDLEFEDMKWKYDYDFRECRRKFHIPLNKEQLPEI